MILLQLNPVVFVFLFLFFQGLACQNSSTGWDRAQSCPSFWGEEAWRCAKAPVCRKTWRDSAASMTSLSLSATSQLTSRGKTVLVSCRQIYAFSWFNWERPFFFFFLPSFYDLTDLPGYSRPANPQLASHNKMPDAAVSQDIPLLMTKATEGG